MWWLFLCFLLLKNPARANEATPSATVVINKFQYNPPLDKNEWVELYNLADVEIDLSNWQLADESNTKKSLTGKKIGAKSSLIFEDGKSWLNNTATNNDGDTVFLKIGDSVIDQVDYKRIDGKILVKGQNVSEGDLILKGKWVGRNEPNSNVWQVFADTDGPINGGINYFDGYRTIVENTKIGITLASDKSGIGTTEIKMREGILENSNCLDFKYLTIGSSLSDGKCYKYEYVATDGVGNSSTFTSTSTIKFDTSKPEAFSIISAFRNILKLKSEFSGSDPESGILNYQYSLSELECGTSTVPNNWSYMNSNILGRGYSGNPLSIVGKATNGAGLESDTGCLNFITDLMAPKVVGQTVPEKGKYKIGDVLKFSFEFNEDIETVDNNFVVSLNSGKANFANKTGNILHFEYVVLTGDLTDNLKIGETKINLNGGNIFDLAGNDAELKIDNLENGIEIDGVAPQISLVGGTYIEVPQFGEYIDLGATASDIPDGDLTNNIIVDNKVDVNLGGFYNVIYSVSDRTGNQSTVTGKVKVVDTTAPEINQLSVTSYELSVNSNEDGYVEWMGKCQGVDNNIIAGENIIKIKNNGDGVYDDCQTRAWDKWGNVGNWQKINSFVIDTTPPTIEFVSPTPNNNTFVTGSQASVAVDSNENLKDCFLEKEKLLSGGFETGNIDGWSSDEELPWEADNLHFESGIWSAKSPILKDEDLVEKSIEQKIAMESEGALTFWWRVSSEKDWDYLKFYIDGTLINKISGEVSWQEQRYNLSIGEHIIQWTYAKDYSGESGEDAGWIDEVKVTGGGSVAPMIIIGKSAQVKLNNLAGGTTKYKVSCRDMFDNKTISEERNIFKNLEKITENILPTPTPYTVFKTSAVIPTIKSIKPTSTKAPTKTPARKLSAVLGIAATPTPMLTPPVSTKLIKSVPWSELKFWGMGLLVLVITSWVILVDKKK